MGTGVSTSMIKIGSVLVIVAMDNISKVSSQFQIDPDYLEHNYLSIRNGKFFYIAITYFHANIIPKYTNTTPQLTRE